MLSYLSPLLKMHTFVFFVFTSKHHWSPNYWSLSIHVWGSYLLNGKWFTSSAYNRHFSKVEDKYEYQTWEVKEAIMPQPNPFIVENRNSSTLFIHDKSYNALISTSDNHGIHTRPTSSRGRCTRGYRYIDFLPRCDLPLNSSGFHQKCQVSTKQKTK